MRLPPTFTFFVTHSRARGADDGGTGGATRAKGYARQQRRFNKCGEDPLARSIASATRQLIRVGNLRAREPGR